MCPAADHDFEKKLYARQLEKITKNIRAVYKTVLVNKIVLYTAYI